MFALTLQGGTIMAVPDVCNTPTPTGPVPVPYPNTGMCNTADPSTASKKVFFSNTPAFNMQTTIPMSNGDNAGTAGGVKSGVFMQQIKFSKGSNLVMIEGKPAVFVGSSTMNNGANCNAVGSVIAPGQVKVDIGR